jgi:hypothetical protein
MPTGLPDKFLWTKMGADAGQAIDAIVHRKDLERQCGEGLFAWGIGNSIPSIERLAKTGTVIPVVFSHMKAKARAIDEKPEKVYVWNSYLKDGVCVPLPAHMLITSRTDKNYYALFCDSKSSLRQQHEEQVFFSQLLNAETGNKLGHSQVTSLVKRSLDKPALKPYGVSFIANLSGPLHCKLANATEISLSLAQELSFKNIASTPEEWMRVVAKVRNVGSTVS